MSAVTKFIPKNHISFIVGWFSHLKLPQFIWNPIISWFAKRYKINLDEAEFTISHYPSLGEFFIRRLKPGLRPVANTWSVHPADSKITQAGKIVGGKLIQAKNKTYQVVDLIQDPAGLDKYNAGFFLTYYLCPTDYHRVHSPVDGLIKSITHIPGSLWPVNEWSTENIPELFSVNERMSVEIETDRGLVCVVFVGATNVGQIELAFDNQFRGNQLVLMKTIKKENLGLVVRRGDELGRFRMGSTVVCLYEKSTVDAFLAEDFLGRTVKVNSMM